MVFKSQKESLKKIGRPQSANKLLSFRPSIEDCELLKKTRKRKIHKARKLRGPPSQFLKDVMARREFVSERLDRIKTCLINPKTKPPQKLNALGKALILAIKSVCSDSFKKALVEQIYEEHSAEQRDLVQKDLKLGAAFINSLDIDRDDDHAAKKTPKEPKSAKPKKTKKNSN